jgi:hypothetical protein
MMPSAIGHDVRREAPQELMAIAKPNNSKHAKKYFFITYAF